MLSIVTPTYNRGEYLKKCYESLRIQTDKDFEWIIVDDGSTDNTEEIVGSFTTTDFIIKYIKKQNGGKHTAINASLDEIDGEYVLFLDSDDYLVPKAVEEVLLAWRQFGGLKEVALITFLKGADEDTPNCKVADNDQNRPVPINGTKRIMIVASDCCETIRTEVLKQFPFPIFENEKFLAEGALWNRVAKQYKCVYINKVIYLCEYLEEGLTKRGRAMRINNPLGGMYIATQGMDRENGYKWRIKSGLLFVIYGYFAGMSAISIIKKSEYKALTAICVPAGWILYKRWRKIYRKL